MTPTLSTLILISTAVLLVVVLWSKKRPGVALPPGPKKLPFIGNLLVAPTKYQWVKYAQWSKEYASDIIHLDVVGTSIIVLHSLESTLEILNQRSTISSSRPYGVMLNKLMGWEWHIGLLPYGNPWRDRRRVFRQEFNPSNSPKHHAVQLKYVQRFLRDVLDHPAELMHHCYYTLGSTIIEITYGLPVCPRDDPTMRLSERGNRHLRRAGITGTYLVDNIPILQYLPSWLPGAGFQRYAKLAYAETMDMIDIPYGRAREQFLEGVSSSSLITRAFLRDETVIKDKQKERVLKDVASSAYAAGADTTPSSLLTFFAAMVLFPEVQRKAQAEVDQVVGSLARLPTFEDRASMPYTQAIVWEAIRWIPVGSLGTPHLLLSDDVYNGYFLPKGSILFPNIWAIMKDPSIFPNPAEFNPERFITPDGELDVKLTETVETAFGFGRRICPGRSFARDSLWLWIASLLSVFNISKAKDAMGKDIIPDVEVLPLFITRIKSFKCDVLPRSKQAERMIHDLDLAGYSSRFLAAAS